MADMIKQDGFREATYIIPKNTGSTFGIVNDNYAGIPLRHIVEAAIAAIIVYLILSIIPLTGMIRITTIIIVEIGVIVFFCIGLKGESVMGFLTSVILYEKANKEYSLAPILFKEDALIHEKKDKKEAKTEIADG